MIYIYIFVLLSQEYLKSDTHGRSTDNTSILQVKQGCEPLNFTGYFLAWDTDKWSVSRQIHSIEDEHFFMIFLLGMLFAVIYIAINFKTLI